VVVEWTGLATFRAAPLGSRFVDQMDVHFSVGQLQFDPLRSTASESPKSERSVPYLALAHYASPTTIPDGPKILAPDSCAPDWPRPSGDLPLTEKGYPDFQQLFLHARKAGIRYEGKPALRYCHRAPRYTGEAAEGLGGA